MYGFLLPPRGYRPRDDATYFPTPWLLSTRGCGVLIDNDETNRHRLGSSHRGAWSWGSDIGGFFSLGFRRLTPELLVRWIELGGVGRDADEGRRRSERPDAGAAPADLDLLADQRQLRRPALAAVHLALHAAALQPLGGRHGHRDAAAGPARWQDQGRRLTAGVPREEGLEPEVLQRPHPREGAASRRLPRHARGHQRRGRRLGAGHAHVPDRSLIRRRGRPEARC